MNQSLQQRINRCQARRVGWEKALHLGAEQWWRECRQPGDESGPGLCGRPQWDDLLCQTEQCRRHLLEMAPAWSALRAWPPAGDGFLDLYELLEQAADQAPGGKDSWR